VPPVRPVGKTGQTGLAVFRPPTGQTGQLHRSDRSCQISSAVSLDSLLICFVVSLARSRRFVLV